MNLKLVAAALAAAGVTVAGAQMGPGMMQGAGPGKGYGMGGPGMMQGAGPGKGHGMGPGMMGNPGDCPMGRHDGRHDGRRHGVMGGGGMGGGMMGGGMMGGGMMGGGMMGGPGFMALEGLNLDKAQRDKVRDILRDSQRKTHALMGSMHELRWQEEDAAKSGDFDAAAARKRFDAHAAIHKQMFEIRLDAHKRIQEVLTPEQREQLRK